MKTSALVNARVLSVSGLMERACVILGGDEIVDVTVDEKKTTSCDEVIDLRGDLLAPGFCDVQVNGGGGLLFNDDPSVDTAAGIARAHRAFGATSILPTLISDDTDKIAAAIRSVDEAVAANVAGIAGLHIEGPFLNEQKKGVHDASKLRRLTPEMLELLTSAQYATIVVTLAPELASREQIELLVARGVIVCAGHTMATYDQAHDAIDAGVTGYTHLFNAMSPLESRNPGIVAAALESAGWCGLIVDGKHVHPAMLKLAIRAKADRRFMLVTDAMPGAGAEIDHFYLGDQRIENRNGECLTSDGRLAGSSLTMVDAFRNAMSMLGLPLEEAARMASTNPATFLGADDCFGSIQPGRRADLVCLGDDYTVRRTWVRGVASEVEKVLA